jgi:hypothetical protein
MSGSPLLADQSSCFSFLLLYLLLRKHQKRWRLQRRMAHQNRLLGAFLLTSIRYSAVIMVFMQNSPS